MQPPPTPPRARRHLTSMEKVPFLDYKEVLVTGGTGFLGRHVCRALVSRGYLPRLLVRVGSEDRIPEDLRRACTGAPGGISTRRGRERRSSDSRALPGPFSGRAGSSGRVTNSSLNWGVRYAGPRLSPFRATANFSCSPCWWGGW